MNVEALNIELKNQFPNLVVLEDEIVLCELSDFYVLCQFIQTKEGLYFDQLASVTGFHNQPKEEFFEIVYNFYSIPYEHKLAVKVKIENADVLVPSLTSIWKAADWFEREVYDLFGIQFSNHPDLRRILLPANWEGFPLRKDYKTQEYYHGIKVDY